jgi:hypothetical protein
LQAKTSLKARYTLVFLETKLPSVMNISDIWVFFGIAKSLGMFMLNREYAIKDFGKSRLFSLQNELYA